MTNKIAVSFYYSENWKQLLNCRCLVYFSIKFSRIAYKFSFQGDDFDFLR